MFGNLFGNRTVLDEASVQWLLQSYAWALKHFDAGVFFRETVLVKPNNDFFPGRETSIQGMASLIFQQVRGYAGMTHWPCRLADPSICEPFEQPKVRIQGALRGSKGVAPLDADPQAELIIPYDSQMVGNPEAIIAGFAHSLAHYLASTATEAPPGGAQNWPHVTEVLAVFMGFGLMMSNSAFNFRPRSCGSCATNAAERTSFLSQYDICYALAIFAVLKEIPDKEVSGSLKKSLRSYYKQAVRDLRSRDKALAELRKSEI
jgi:hypothetical protein